MSNFIIGNKPIKSISGPVRVCVLKPVIDLKKRFEEEGGRLPYIIFFGDQHFERKENCKNCDCNTVWRTGEGWSKGDCCYEIDDPEFLRLFDGIASKNFPIDFYTEQIYEPRLGDPDIYKINKYNLHRADKTGYLSKFIHEYRTCYSKKDRRTKKYKLECPTRDLRWHFIDTRVVEYGNSGEALLYKGVMKLYEYLYIYFNKNKPKYENDPYEEGRKLFEKYTTEITMVFDIIVNGPEFINKYITEDSNFLLTKQVKKQVIPELRNIDLWKTIITETIRGNFYNYIDESSFTTYDYEICMNFYKHVMAYISDDEITKEDFLIKRKDLMKMIEKYDLFSDKLENLEYMYTLTTATSMMDIYTITRMLKKPKDGVPGFCSMFYAGDLHATNIISILTRYFGYSVLGQSVNENVRCQDVRNIDFNLFKVKQEYK